MKSAAALLLVALSVGAAPPTSPVGYSFDLIGAGPQGELAIVCQPVGVNATYRCYPIDRRSPVHCTWAHETMSCEQMIDTRRAPMERGT